MNTISIGQRQIGANEKPYLIAEAGINHGGNLDTARKLVIAAADAGADAVKLQTYQSSEFLAPNSDFFDVLKQAELSNDQIQELMALAEEHGITLFSSVFDEKSAGLMASLGAPAFKIASGDITHLPLLKEVARSSRPMIISSGGATVGEIEEAISAVRSVNGDAQIAILHCISNYPTSPEQTNLACLAGLKHQFDVPVGFSDHTLGETAAIAAVSLGAEIIEKHFTLDRNADGPDHALSSDPAGLRSLAVGIEVAWRCIGQKSKAPIEPADFIPLIRRSMNARRTIRTGETLEPDMVATRRPGTGIQPREADLAFGREVRSEIPEGTTITWDHLK